MRLLDSVRVTLMCLNGSYINYNNELILIPKFNVYVMLDDVDTDDDFKIKLCKWFTRDCCCALRYAPGNKLDDYYLNNTTAFNTICGTNFTVEDMRAIYESIGNNVNPKLAEMFVKGGLDMCIIKCNMED